MPALFKRNIFFLEHLKICTFQSQLNLKDFVSSKLQCVLLRTLKFEEETIKVTLFQVSEHGVYKKIFKKVCVDYSFIACLKDLRGHSNNT